MEKTKRKQTKIVLSITTDNCNTYNLTDVKAKWSIGVKKIEIIGKNTVPLAVTTIHPLLVKETGSKESTALHTAHNYIVD